MSKWIEKRTRPVLPLYLAALTWPVASLILPPYRLVNLVIIAALSTVVYLVSSRFCPTRVQRVEQPYATGSENTDAMLNGIAANLRPTPLATSAFSSCRPARRARATTWS